jgi:general secretion pathway protein F
MGAFEYVAVDANGRETKGVIEGDTPKHVRQLLRERALLPVAVTEVAEQTAATGSRRLGLRRQGGGRLNAADLAVVTRQLATLVKSALPLEEALLAVSQQTDKPKVRSVILGVRARVMEGHTLADGLSNFRGSFPEIYRATVAASEQSGHLDSVLERLADYTESRQELRQRTVGALLYPVLLFMVCIAIVVFLLTTVVPKITEVFRNSNRRCRCSPDHDRDERFPAGVRDLPADGADRGATCSTAGSRSRPTATAGTDSCCGCPCSAGSCAEATRRGSRAR